MAKKVLIDTPLSELTLRRYEKPFRLGKRELVKKVCLSLGLLQPGDSRDIITDILLVLLASREPISAEDIRRKVETYRKENGMAMLGTASSNIRRQLKRLRDAFLIEKAANRYRITENATLTEIFEEKIERFLLPSLIERVKLYLQRADEEFSDRTEHLS